MSLEALYRIHDALESALRELEPRDEQEHTREWRMSEARTRVWRAHDELERVIVKEEAARGKK